MNNKVSVVIPASGMGKRFGGDIKKQFFLIDGKPIIYYTLYALNKAYPFNAFIIGAAEEDFSDFINIAEQAGIDKNKIKLTEGGAERVDTVLNALMAVDTEYCAVHDAVRPFINKEIVSEVIECAMGMSDGGAICALDVCDTVKHVVNSKIRATLDRKQIFLAHTPQVFKTQQLIKAIERAHKFDLPVTDEASACEEAGLTVKIARSTPDNIKITKQTDLILANILIKKYFGEI